MQENKLWKIYLIDDDEDDFLITREMLAETKGVRVQLTWASTYETARETLFAGQQFDAVLVDYDLGLHTGLDLIREATVREPALPMILLTGRGSYDVDVEAMQAGASLYLTKDEVNPLLLERSIRYAIDHKRSEQALMQANAALRESEDRFRRLVSVMPAAMYTCDSQGRLTYYNQRAVEIWGMEPPLGDLSVRFCGGNRLFLEDGTPLRHDDTPMAEAVRKGTSTRGAEVMEERPDGSMVTTSVNIDPLYDASGCISGAVNVFVDITEKKKAEALLLAQKQILQDQKHELQEQKRELEMKNQQLEGLFEHAPAALALFLAQPPYMVLAHNQVYQNLWNTPHRDESLVGKYIPDYIPQAEENGIFDIFEQVAKTGKGCTVYHFNYDGLDSGPKWWNWNLSPVFSEGKLVAYAHMLVDATEEVTAQRQMRAELDERRRTEQNLKFALSRMQGLINSTVIGITISDEQGSVYEANDYFLNLIGADFAALEAGQVRWDTITPPEHRAADLRAFQEIRATGACAPYEKQYERPDGARVWVLVSIAALPNEPERQVAFILDITDRKNTEFAYRDSQQALMQSEDRFRVMADSMPQLVWMAEPDGKVIYYNRRAREYHGINKSDHGWEWAPVVHDDDLQTTVDAWTNALQTGTLYEVEHRVRTADGSFRWHLSRGVPMIDPQGNVQQWYGTATDIHEQKVTEAALRQREAQLELLVKSVESSNRDLERFAFVASHDLQEPLRKVRAFGDRLHQALQGRLSEQEKDYLNRMENAAARMQDMVDDLLQLSRVSASKRDFGPVDLNSVARDVLADLRAKIDRAGGKVVVDALPTVQGDRVLLRQLLLHLVDNSIKFRRDEEAPFVQLHAEHEGNHVRLSVQDNGIGFDPAYADRIFQPFTRLHSLGVFEGSGMGLAICQKIIERHQGQITVTSQPGAGSLFEIVLPSVSPPA